MMCPWWTTSCFLMSCCSFIGSISVSTLSTSGDLKTITHFIVHYNYQKRDFAKVSKLLWVFCCQSNYVFSPSQTSCSGINSWHCLRMTFSSASGTPPPCLITITFSFFNPLNKWEWALLTVASERRCQPCGRPCPSRNEFGPPAMMVSLSCRRGGVKTSPASHLLPPLLVPDDGN